MIKTDILSLSQGSANLNYPAELTADDLDDIFTWLTLRLAVIRRERKAKREEEENDTLHKPLHAIHELSLLLDLIGIHVPAGKPIPDWATNALADHTGTPEELVATLRELAAQPQGETE